MDRNANFEGFYWWVEGSLSARRAWIEIFFLCILSLYEGVALRKESVDRNIGGVNRAIDIVSRSPQGERG